MSTVGTDGTYRNESTARFTHGSLRLVLDQATPLPVIEAKQAGTQADKVMSRLVRDAFQTTSVVSDYIENRQACSGSSFTEGSNWQEVGTLHVRVRVAISVEFDVPEFVLSEAVDLALQGFRKHVRVEMDPSYKAFVAEEESRKAAASIGRQLFDDSAEALAFLSSMLGEDTPLGVDGMAGMMVGRPFGRFKGGNGFAG